MRIVSTTKENEMAVGIKVGSITDEIGTPEFLHAFFSTISANLETNGWGSKFPILVNNLYQGSLSPSEVTTAIDELNIIKKELAKIPPTKVVWDIEDRAKQPPWGNKISNEISSLANYFVTSTGHDVITIILEAFEDAKENKMSVNIVQC